MEGPPGSDAGEDAGQDAGIDGGGGGGKEDGGADSGVASDGGSGGDAGSAGDGGWEVIDLDGGRVIAVPFPTPMWLGSPRLSPDGTRVAFTSVPGDVGPYQVATANLDGSNFRILDPDAGTALTAVAWSPDATEVYWTALDGIRRTSSAGGAPLQLVYDYRFNGFVNPDVSVSDGFMVWGVNGSSLIRWLDLQTGEVRAFQYMATRVRISPDESSIAFTLDGDLGVCAIDGGAGEPLLGGPAQWVIDGGNPGLSAEWLAGGQSLALATDRGLEVVEIANPSNRTLVFPQAGIASFDVSKDAGTWIFAIEGQAPLYVFHPDASVP